MKIEHLLVDSTITEKRRGNWNRQASYDQGRQGPEHTGAGMLAAADQRAKELPATKLTARQEKIKQKSADNYKNLARRDAAAPPEAAPSASAEAPANTLPATTQQQETPPANTLPATTQQQEPVNLTATPADNVASTNLPATTQQQQAPAGDKPSGWEQTKRAGAAAAGALGSVGRGVKAVGGAVGDAATGVGHAVGGVGNLAARTVGGVAQTIGAIGGGLKAGFKGQDYNSGKSYSDGSSGSSQWGNNGSGGTSGGVPDEVDDLRATIRSMDQRLRRAGI
jgi:hypothetical protein